MILISEGRGVRRGCIETGICREVFYSAMREYKPLADQYARARETEADVHADAVMEVAEDESLDWGEKRIRIDALKWSAAVRRPKLYGQKVEVTEVSDPLSPEGKRRRAGEIVRRIEQLREVLE